MLLTAISGTVWNDINGNGVIDRGEGPLSGWGVYWDVNVDGFHQQAEPADTTDASGQYSITVPFGTDTALIREVVPNGWRPTVPRGGVRGVRIPFGTGVIPGMDFGNARDVAAPSDLTAAPRADGVHLAFTDNSINESSFVVERRLDAEPDTAFVEVARVTSSTSGATGARISAIDTTATAGETYAYRVRGANPLGTYDPSNVVSVLAGSPGGTGVRAIYYNQELFAGPRVTLDAPVDADENLGVSTPDPRILPDTFSGTFSGLLLAQVSGSYSFFTASDDGIDFQLIDPDSSAVLVQGPPGGINIYRGMPDTGFQDSLGTATLEAGKKYVVHWRFNQGGGGAGYRVGWSGPDTPQEVLPTELLFPVKLAAPTDLAAAPRADGVHLAFTDNSTAENVFVIERKLDGQPDGTFVSISNVLASTTPAQTGARYSVTDPSAILGQTYVYRVRAENDFDASDPSATVTITAARQGGTGVRATYYNERFFTGDPIVLDAPVDADENFGAGSPDPRIDPDTFSGVFAGLIKPEFTEPYTFYTTSDDGIDLRIVDPENGQVLLDGPPNGIERLRGPISDTGFPFFLTDTLGPVNLQAGKQYAIQWRFSENGGGAGYRLGWSSPSIPQEVLPTDLLFPAPYTPRDVQAFAMCNEKVIITFTDVSTAETGVEVQRAADPDGPFTTIGMLPPGAGGTQTFTDVASASNPLAAGQTLYYRLRAVAFDSSPFTQPVKVTVEDGSTRLLLTGNAVYLPGADNDVETPGDNLLRLTDNLPFQNSGAFTTAGWDLERAGQGTGGAAGFNTRFIFRVPSHTVPPADGFTFVLRSDAPTSLGQPGSGLGYQGMPNSLAIKFDPFRLSTFSGFNQTGLYAGGAMDDNGTDLPFDITDGSTFQVDLSFDAAARALTERITNLSAPTAPPFQTTYTTATTPAGPAPLDLGQLLGGHCGFVGFTGATGGDTAVQLITAFAFDGQDVPLTAVPPSPKVTKVYVSGSAWTNRFKTSLQNQGKGSAVYGYAVPAADQLRVLPWSNLDQVSVVFSEDVDVNRSDLRVAGAAVASYAPVGFAYDGITRTATWTLGRKILADRLTIELNADGPDGVKNTSDGVYLDGEWTNPTGPGAVSDTFPSGNGVPGGDFKFGINVLAGDVNGHGKVDAASLLQVRRRMSIAKASASLYSIFFDVNGDGVINALDLASVLRQQSQSLPAVQ